jgi:transaldolase
MTHRSKDQTKLIALRTRILVDGGGPLETLRIRELMGFVDGQTTNPSLIAKNPQIRQRLASERPLSIVRREPRIDEERDPEVWRNYKATISSA